ncbi:hypothetical protein Trydic_g3866 [Trypoxylus dichotomus]
MMKYLTSVLIVIVLAHAATSDGDNINKDENVEISTNAENNDNNSEDSTHLDDENDSPVRAEVEHVLEIQKSPVAADVVETRILANVDELGL